MVLRLLLFLVRFLPSTAAVPPGSAGLGLESASVSVAVLGVAAVVPLPPLLGAAHDWVEWGVEVEEMIGVVRKDVRRKLGWGENGLSFLFVLIS